MKILVCLSNVPDTTTKVRFKDNNTSFDANGVQWIINPWDELALTRALELKEGSNGVITNVSVITVGEAFAEPTIRKALAIGADNAYRVNSIPKDAFFTAFQIAEIAKKESFDIIFAGIESSDYNGSMVGSMISEFLNISSVSSVSAVNIENNEIKVTREIPGGKEFLNVTAPLVAVVQKGIAINPRIPSMRGIMTARTKPLIVSEAVACDSLTEFINYELPQPKGKCKMVSADNLKELVQLLHNEAKVL